MSSDLTTTSFAILGLLAVKPWTTYELAKQMDIAVNRFWPRARSKVYEEPKKLVAHGLAKAAGDAVGRRRRTTYSITPKGRRALARWLAEPGEGPTLEFEQLLKVFFGDHGSKRSLLGTIRAAGDWAARMAVDDTQTGERYLGGNAEFQHRAAQNLLVGRFLADFVDLVRSWSEWAEETVHAWPDDIRTAEPDVAMLERLTSRSRRTARRAASG